MLGINNWLDPEMVDWHHATALGAKPRGYTHHCSDDYYRNLMTCALVIGGEKWINKVYSSFRTQPRMVDGKTMHQLYGDAWARGEEHAAYLAGIRHRRWTNSLRNSSWRGLRADCQATVGEASSSSRLIFRRVRVSHVAGSGVTAMLL